MDNRAFNQLWAEWHAACAAVDARADEPPSKARRVMVEARDGLAQLILAEQHRAHGAEVSESLSTAWD